MSNIDHPTVALQRQAIHSAEQWLIDSYMRVWDRMTYEWEQSGDSHRFKPRHWSVVRCRSIGESSES